MVPPAWRSAEIKADPDPERPAGSSARAAFMAAGSTVPRPAPTSVIQAAVRP
jgi:hypothetical protein